MAHQGMAKGKGGLIEDCLAAVVIPWGGGQEGVLQEMIANTFSLCLVMH